MTAIPVAEPVYVTPAQAAWQRFRRHRLAMAGLIIIVLLVFASVFGPFLLPFDDTFIDMM